MRSLHFSILSALVGAFATPTLLSAAEAPYDLLIRGGRIVDGSGNPWFQGDVAVRGERIVAVGPRRPRRKHGRSIDAKGLIVAPGFIDMHSHSDTLLLEDGHAQSKIRQGVTTDVLGEGGSAGPYKGKLTPRSTTIDGQAHRRGRRWASTSTCWRSRARASTSPPTSA